MTKPSVLQELRTLKPLLLPAAIIYVFTLFVLPSFVHEWDAYCWYSWANQLKEKGLVSAYEAGSQINYLPLYTYVLKLFSYLYATDDMQANIYKLKAITWLFDIATILMLCSLVKKESKQWRYFIFGLLNVGFFYNTIVWNQVDGILTFFVFAAFFFAYHKNTFGSLILFLLALNFKLQAIVFAPVLVALWWPELTLKNTIRYVFSLVFIQALIILPFLINGNAKNILKVAFGSVDYFQFVSMNAFNIWHLLLNGDLMTMPDNTPVLFGYTYKSIGLGLFSICCLLICVPLYLRIYKARLSKQAINFDLKWLLLSMALICYTFFFFNTQMHERYIHPVIIFLTALAFLYKQWGVWVLVSLNYAFSLDSICNYFKINQNHVFFFYADFMAAIYAIGLVWLFILWYKALPNRAFYFRRLEQA
jgi:Gpi18-like mannosyltransferase